MNLYRNRNLLFSLAAAPLLFVLLQVPLCFPIDVVPESDTNPVGRSHTVVATVDAPDPQAEWLTFFFIFFGPNAGMTSLTDCNIEDPDCDPECSPLPDCLGEQCSPSCFGVGDGTASWTYRSNGEEGRDYIGVCTFGFEEFIFGELPGAQQLVPAEELEEFIVFLEEELGCDVVVKNWEDRPTPTPSPTATPTQTPTPTPAAEAARPNLGGIFGPLPNQNRETPVPATQATTAPSTVRPPNTGDAGVR